jgi:hypothetical protein
VDRRWTNAALVLLVLVNVWLVYALLTRDGSTPKEPSWAGSGSRDAAAEGSGAPVQGSAGPSPHKSSPTRPAPRPGRLVIEHGPLVAAPFRPVAIRGVWRPAPAGGRATVQVQMRRGRGWSPFPLSAVVRASGRFTAYAALGPRGHYLVRVVGSGGRPVSRPVDVTVG